MNKLTVVEFNKIKKLLEIFSVQDIINNNLSDKKSTTIRCIKRSTTLEEYKSISKRHLNRAKNEVLVLKRCITSNRSFGGFTYPNKGKIVEALDWEDNNDCGNGLHGWTENHWGYYSNDLRGNWVVIKVDKNDGFVELDDKVKFRKGIVVYNGESLDRAKSIMLKEQPNMIFHCDDQTAGDNSTQRAGDSSTQTAGYGSTQRAGDSSAQTAGGGSTQTAGYGSTQTAGGGSTQTAGGGSTQTAGGDSTQTAGDNSTQRAGGDSTQRAGDSSTQTAGYGSTQRAGDSSTQRAGYGSTQRAGDSSAQTAGGGSTQTAGYGSLISHYIYNRSYNIVKPGKHSSVTSINLDDHISNNFISKTIDTTYVINGECEVIKKYINTKDSIKNLEEFEIIVFGSNLNGNHSGGLAKECVEKYNAKDGVGEGHTGQCYAFPTLDKDMHQVTEIQLQQSVQKLISFANNSTGSIILLTKVGCGIAGFKEKDIKEYFKDLPANIIKPKGW